VVRELALEPIRTSAVGDPVRRGISGGERKRVSLGQELLNSATRFLVLDEPTTGLDPHISVDIFRLLRRLTDDGRIVLVVTHQVDDAVMEQLDKVLVLGVHGKVVYFGPPAGMLPTLNLSSMAELFARLKDPGAAELLTQRYLQSTQFGQEAVAARVLAHPPAEQLLETASRARLSDVSRASAEWRVAGSWRSFLHQLSVLTRRYARVRFRDASGLAVALGQAPLIAAGCWLVLRDSLVRDGAHVVPGALPFVLVVSAFWLGCASSVREIVGEQAILKRERMAGLEVGPYVLSKLAVSIALVMLQSALIMGAAALLFGLGARHVQLMPALWILVLVGAFGVALGLCVSAACRSSEAAVAALPAVLIPQLLFGGLLVPFHEMPTSMRTVSYAMASRWGMDGFTQAGASGVLEGVVDRGRATLFAVPGGEAVARDWFLGVLGLARETGEFGPLVPLASYGSAVTALAALLLAATLTLYVTVRARF
jgi:hypothetical protein